MKRAMFVVLCLACAVGAAWGGEVLKDDEGRALVPVAKVKCVQLFEVKDIRVALCRVAGTAEYAFVVKVIFVHHEPSPLEVTVTADMGAGSLFRKPILTQHASRVKANAPTTVCLLAPRALCTEPRRLSGITLTPQISFAFTRSPGE